MVTAGRQRLHELTGGFRIVLNDQDTAMTFRHGLGLRATGSKPNSFQQNRKPLGGLQSWKLITLETNNFAI